MEWIETFEAILRAMRAQAEAERQKIDLAYRHQGLGTALVAHIESLPEYSGLRGILLTRDAHELCRKFGYGVVNGRAMVKALNCQGGYDHDRADQRRRPKAGHSEEYTRSAARLV